MGLGSLCFIIVYRFGGKFRFEIRYIFLSELRLYHFPVLSCKKGKFERFVENFKDFVLK